MNDKIDYTRSGGGPTGWMVRNGVTPNLLMLVLLVGGLLMAGNIKQEVFPEFTLDFVTVTVPYPGASPAEVEQGIVLAVEEEVRGIDGVKEVTSTANEGSGRVSIELEEGGDTQRAYQDIKQAVDRIVTFPEDAEKPRVSLLSRRRQVVELVVHGDVSEWTLRGVLEEVRDELLQDPGITQVDVIGARDYVIAIEIPQEKLRAYGLTLGEVARAVDQAAVELPGGSVRTEAGEIMLRMRERRDWADEFARIPIITGGDGSILTLADIGDVVDGFEDTDRVGTFDGQLAMRLDVYRIGDQTPIGVSEAVHERIEEIEPGLPPGIGIDILNDRSDIYAQRLNLLLRNGSIGLLLVFIVLGLFLELRVAFWVAMGIPTSFLGALLFLPLADISINMISMFAFIVALGIVVDDAIVAGENIYEYRKRGMGAIQAAIKGARDVMVPITFSILTNIAAFIPLTLVPGMMGKIWRVIPIVISTVFIISWVESLLILPSHMGHGKEGGRPWRLPGQRRLSEWLANFSEETYGGFAEKFLRRRYLTLSMGLAVLVVVLGYVISGRMGMQMMPRVESDISVVTAVLPYGSPLSETQEVRDRLTAGFERAVAGVGREQECTGLFALIDGSRVEVTAFLTDSKVRPMTTTDLTAAWRRETGEIPGLESLRFESDRGGPGSGKSLTVELSHRDIATLEAAGASVAASLAEFSNVKDIDDGFAGGKEQLDYTMTDRGLSLGLTAGDVARQLRNSFYGSEALRQQRGRSEVRVLVRLPEAERISEFDIEELMIRTPAGTDVPLREVAEVERGRAYTSITRRNGRRTQQVTADVEPPSQTNQVNAVLSAQILPQLQEDYPGLSSVYEGREADMRESTSSLYSGFGMAMLGIYVLLAIPFRSYTRPAVVMFSIPFGIVGAVFGHLIMGYSMSLISMMGIVALSGVVVNDALVLVDFTDKMRQAGHPPAEAVRLAGVRRFRPILLTTLTTFGGLAPMIFETSRQARFMIPMALSLGYGVVFATAITLVMVPCLYLVVEDAHELAARIGARIQRHLPDRGASS